MRKDSVQPRKRKQPAQGRRRKRKVTRVKGKENRRSEVVLDKLLHTYCRGYNTLATPGDKENEAKIKKTRSLPAYTYQAPSPLKAGLKTDIGYLEEEEEEEDKYKWPTPAFSLTSGKTDDSGDPSRCVAPLDVSRGMRDYTCSHVSCRHLQFTCLDGPNSVREHMKLYH